MISLASSGSPYIAGGSGTVGTASVSAVSLTSVRPAFAFENLTASAVFAFGSQTINADWNRSTRLKPTSTIKTTQIPKIPTKRLSKTVIKLTPHCFFAAQACRAVARLHTLYTIFIESAIKNRYDIISEQYGARITRSGDSPGRSAGI